MTIHVASAPANLYTATPSGIHPSDSTDPTRMDDWEVGDPGCASTRQGDPCTTAAECGSSVTVAPQRSSEP